MFREAVLHFLGAGKKETDQNKYCTICKKMGKADCANCTKKQ